MQKLFKTSLNRPLVHCSLVHSFTDGSWTLDCVQNTMLPSEKLTPLFMSHRDKTRGSSWKVYYMILTTFSTKPYPLLCYILSN